MKLNLSPTARKALIPLLLLLIIRVVWIPAMEWREDAEGRVLQLQKSLAKLESLEKNRPRLERTHKRAEECIGELEAYFHPNAPTHEALQLEVQKSLEELARQNGLKVERTEWMYASDDGLMTQTPMRIIFKSTLSQLYNFVLRVESEPRLYTIDGMQMTRMTQGELQGTLDISAYNLVSKKEK